MLPVLGRDGKHARMRGRDSAIDRARVRGRYDRDPPGAGEVEQPGKEAIAWAAQAQVDDIGAVVERELQGLRQCERAAERRIGRR